jgi:hypothetical protein
MRKIYLAAVMIMAAAIAVNAQGLGIKAGINLANMSIDPKEEESPQIILGFHAGVVYEIELAEGFYFSPGLLFSQKGAQYSFQDYDDEFEGEVSIDLKTSINYLEVPLNLVYKIDMGGANLVFEAGPYLGYALDGKIDMDFEAMGISFNMSEDIEFGSEDDQMRRIDYGINAGIGLEFQNFKVGAQYGLGLGNLSNDDDATIKHRVIGVSVGYFFRR